MSRKLTQAQLNGAVDMAITLATDKIVQYIGGDPNKVFIDLLRSKTGQMLYYEECKFWWEGAESTAMLYFEEKGIDPNNFK